MAVLADDSLDWKPQTYGFEVLGCQHTLHFPVAKLMDYAAQELALENDPNPFALVTLAHLQTKATRQDPKARFDAKWHLIKTLLNRGWDKERIVELLRVIDWMMHLPEHFKQQLWQNLNQLATEKNMAYVTSFEEIAIEKGMQAGIQQGMQQGMQAGEAAALRKLLTKRFGAIPAAKLAQITTASPVQIDAWLDRVLDAPSLDLVFEPLCH